MKLTTLADNALEDLNRAHLDMARIQGAMHDALAAHPGAQHFEVIRAGRTELFCWRHERPVQACWKQNDLCAGDPIAINDPTGEAAIASDKARDDRRRYRILWQEIALRADELIGLHQRYSDNRVVNDRAGIGVCEGCRRYCDGVKDNRLRPVGEGRYCNACRMRLLRQKPNGHMGTTQTRRSQDPTIPVPHPELVVNSEAGNTVDVSTPA